MGASGPLSLGIYLGSKSRQTSTQVVAAIATEIQEILGREADSPLLDAMIDACHQNAFQTTGEPASDDELLYFTSAKAKIIAQSPNIRNHVAVLRKAVPECFVGEAFVAFRIANRGRRDQAEGELERLERELAAVNTDLIAKKDQYALWDRVCARHKGESGFDMKAIAEDPELDSEGKKLAEGMMDRLGRFTTVGL